MLMPIMVIGIAKNRIKSKFFFITIILCEFVALVEPKTNN